MPAFSRLSQEKLLTCHPSLQTLFNEVIKTFDCTIIEGHRPRERQEKLLAEGKTKTLRSKHLNDPSTAVDVVPYPVLWPEHASPQARHKALARFYLFAGWVLATAHNMGISLRWGGDWDQDKDVFDQSFDDLVHFELMT